jgi:hypothetical protein
LSEQIGLSLGGTVHSPANAESLLHFNISPEVIRLTVMMYVHYPLSLRQVEDLLSERGIDICHDTVRFWWNRFGPMFAAAIRPPLFALTLVRSACAKAQRGTMSANSACADRTVPEHGPISAAAPGAGG